MKLLGTYLVVLALLLLLGVFVWGWYSGKVIPELVFSGLLGLIGTLVGYVWLRGKERE